MKNICFPTDFSELSLNALPFVVSLAKKYDANIHLIHVMPDSLLFSAERQIIYSDLVDDFKARLNEIKSTLEKDLPAHKIFCIWRIALASNKGNRITTSREY